MKIFISADIEGITGVANQEETTSSAKYFIDQMTKEVSAACVGANEAGAVDIIVKDAHLDETLILQLFRQTLKSTETGQWDRFQ